MGQTATPTRHHRTMTVDFHDETTSLALVANSKAFVEFILAFLLSIGFQLRHKASCNAGDRLTRHSHDARVRLGGLTIWRVQCTTCQAVFTVLPHVVLRDRQMRPEVARDALLATLGGLSLEWCAVRCNLSPMALYRLVCAFGHPTLLARARQRQRWRVCALGQRLRHFVDDVTTMAGAANGARVRRWCQDKKAGW